MQIARLYMLLLCVAGMSLFVTMLYMTSVYPSDIILTVGRHTRIYEGKCPMHQASVTSIEKLYYTKSKTFTNKTSDWVPKWPIKVTGLQPCKMFLNRLIGRVNITKSVTADDVKIPSVISKVKYGGVYWPKHCKLQEKVAIIIPYRDRDNHLEILVNYLHNMLQRQQLHYGIYVVEMALPVQFNRGLLANAGYLTARSIGNYTCYIFHDVDLLPLNDRNIYNCGLNPRHLVAASTRFPNGTLPYRDYIGGVIALSASHMETINGFSNLYFGWGGEDDDLNKRLQNLNMIIERPQRHIGTYMALPHDSDISNPPNPYREFLTSQAEYRMRKEGLNSMQYNRKSIEFRPLFTWILVDCVESEVMENYPDLRADPKLMYKEKNKTPMHYLRIIKSDSGLIMPHKIEYIKQP